MQTRLRALLEPAISSLVQTDVKLPQYLQQLAKTTIRGRPHRAEAQQSFATAVYDLVEQEVLREGGGQ